MTKTDVIGSLPRSVPESQSVASSALLEFLSAATRANCELHSLMVVRYGHVIAEGWCAPYRRDAVHSLYSLSKSFTSTAVGFAVAESKLEVSDSVIQFFPDKLPEKISSNLAALRVEHLLTMSVGHDTDPTEAMTQSEDWVKTFLASPIEHVPGSVFFYNTAASYVLSAIVQKVTSQKIIDYLEPRLFGPLQIGKKRWESCPQGINTGGWGLSVTTESLAKFGQLYLQKGRWNGKQLLPADWIEAATTAKIQQPASWNTPAYFGADIDPAAALEYLKQTNDWYQGYGYQFWRCRHGAYRGDGAFGQMCIVIPDKDAVVAITTRTMDMQALMDLVWQILLPAMQDKALPNASDANLRHRFETMALPLPKGNPTSAIVKSKTDLIFKLESNSLTAEIASFRFHDDACTFMLKSTEGASAIRCGIGKWVDGTTDMPGTPPKFISVADLRPARVAATGAWKDESTFLMQWRYYEMPHYDIVTCRFDGDRISIEFENDMVESSNGKVVDKRPVLHGRAFT